MTLVAANHWQLWEKRRKSQKATNFQPQLDSKAAIDTSLQQLRTTMPNSAIMLTMSKIKRTILM